MHVKQAVMNIGVSIIIYLPFDAARCGVRGVRGLHRSE